MSEEENLEEPAKAAALILSMGAAGFAAIDQALQGELQQMEFLAENSETIDTLGHYALGAAGSILTEETYSRISDDTDEGLEPFRKYGLMIAGSLIAGGAGQASQYVISGTPELYSVYQSGLAGTFSAQFQIWADSNKSSEEEY